MPRESHINPPAPPLKQIEEEEEPTVYMRLMFQRRISTDIDVDFNGENYL